MLAILAGVLFALVYFIAIVSAPLHQEKLPPNYQGVTLEQLIGIVAGTLLGIFIFMRIDAALPKALITDRPLASVKISERTIAIGTVVLVVVGVATLLIVALQYFHPIPSPPH